MQIRTFFMIQQSTVVENKEIRSERYTSKYLNKEKLCLLKRTIKDVKKLKNYYSLFCFEHLYDLFVFISFLAIVAENVCNFAP